MSQQIRTCPESIGLLTESLVHLPGMDLTTQATPTFLTQHQLADLLRLSERTLEEWRLTYSGPPYLKLERHARYDVHDVPGSRNTAMGKPQSLPASWAGDGAVDRRIRRSRAIEHDCRRG